MLHGARSYLLQDANGRPWSRTRSPRAWTTPVGPEHSHLHDLGRAEYRPITDSQAMEAFALLCRTEGIIPPSRARTPWRARWTCRELGPDALLLVNLSGRGDKDVETASAWFGLGKETAPTDDGRARRRGRPRRRPGPPLGDADTTTVRTGTRCDGLAERIGAARAEGRSALIAYLPVGYPDVPTSIEAMVAAVEGGADVVESASRTPTPAWTARPSRRPWRSPSGPAPAWPTCWPR